MYDVHGCSDLTNNSWDMLDIHKLRWTSCISTNLNVQMCNAPLQWICLFPPLYSAFFQNTGNDSQVSISLVSVNWLNLLTRLRLSLPWVSVGWDFRGEAQLAKTYRDPRLQGWYFSTGGQLAELFHGFSTDSVENTRKCRKSPETHRKSVENRLCQFFYGFSMAIEKYQPWDSYSCLLRCYRKPTVAWQL